MADREPDLYEVLGVRPDADADELSRAYRRRLRQLHPDTRAGQGAGPAADDRDGLARVLDAYEVLRDPQRRADYDAERAARARRSPPPRDPRYRYRADGTPVPGYRPPARSRRVVVDLGFVRLRIDLGDLP
ncbi:J domain-containing protein [Pseudonocardia sp. C8]|uniref:J domain-containing protein n=1 Tax=Pseudonocardia sp. C8 TaxID=2762759 RepID=UPI00164328B4|nr:J domain-containing protein [Pseudonocardia sp. C8]MBC3191021.1 J domain-containing protein [Pseudonocardia sp. C8]